MVTSATYGGKDCTQQIKSHIKNGELKIWVNNNIIGDPQPGVLKKLLVTLESGEQLSFNEHELAVYPKSVKTRLGIFYSNNDHPAKDPTISLSLKYIKEIPNIDVVTCVWNRIKDNPFTELIAHHKVSSHLGQILQILQCLYFAQQVKEYEYVSFFEHDVLYPSNYCKFPDFNRGEILVNMNYGGLCKNGWQQRNQNDQPMHQMTMHFQDAIDHFISILPNALKTNSGCVESNQKRIEWNCPNQAIHVNHGYHFTSHNSIYSKQTTPNHEYWGNNELYSKLFV